MVAASSQTHSFFLVGDVTTCKRMWEPFMSDEYGRGRVWRRVRSCLTVVSQSTMCPSPSMLKCYPPTYPTFPTQPADLPRGGNWLDAQTGQNPRFNCKMSRGVGATEAHVRKIRGASETPAWEGYVINFFYVPCDVWWIRTGVQDAAFPRFAVFALKSCTWRLRWEADAGDNWHVTVVKATFGPIWFVFQLSPTW